MHILWVCIIWADEKDQKIHANQRKHRLYRYNLPPLEFIHLLLQHALISLDLLRLLQPSLLLLTPRHPRAQRLLLRNTSTRRLTVRVNDRFRTLRVKPFCVLLDRFR